MKNNEKILRKFNYNPIINHMTDALSDYAVQKLKEILIKIPGSAQYLEVNASLCFHQTILSQSIIGCKGASWDILPDNPNEQASPDHFDASLGEYTLPLQLPDEIQLFVNTCAENVSEKIKMNLDDLKWDYSINHSTTDTTDNNYMPYLTTFQIKIKNPFFGMKNW